MLDAIIGWAVAAGAAGAAALAIWGLRWKTRSARAERKIDDYQQSSDEWQEDAARRVEVIRRQAAGKAPIDPKERKDFEKERKDFG